MPSIRILPALTCCALALAAVAPASRAVTICGDGLRDSFEGARLSELDLDYQKKRFDSLSASSDPQDWALAALLPTRPEVADNVARASQLTRATAVAPQDARVHWMALMAARTLPDAAGLIAYSREALSGLEPDNAAVWLELFGDAVARGDAAGADAALARMAASTRADDHYGDLVKATLDVGRRFPRQAEYLSILASTGPMPGPWSYVETLATTAAYAGGAYQPLVQTCRAPATAESVRRVECAAIGRLLAAKGSTLVANRIGSALLRVSRNYTDADVRLAREQDWLIAQRIALGSTEGIGANALIASVDDLIESGSEIAAYRRTVARAGLATTPPDDWVDTQSPFSRERLRGDGVLAASAPPVH